MIGDLYRVKNNRLDRYLVTGATGFIGSMIVKQLLQQENENGNQTHITIISRDLNKAKAMFDIRKLDIIHADITDSKAMEAITEEFDYIIHCAAETKSAQMINKPVETAEVIVNGTKNILEVARRCNVKSMVYLSSMEVYGQVPDTGERITEDVMGSVDILCERSCYPLGKRMAENLCFSYHKEYDIPVKMVRLALTFGTGILPGENRVHAQFANAVRHNKDIVLHTPGNSVGNYCGSEDAVEAILLLLTKGQDGDAYNIANEAATMTIFEMAKLVADKVANGKIKVVFDIPKDSERQLGYAAATGLRLSTAKIRSLGWNPKTSLEDMYHNMIQWMDDNNFE